jgi:hypothetical protein
MRTYKLIWANGEIQVKKLNPLQIADYMRMLIKKTPNDSGIILADIKIATL